MGQSSQDSMIEEGRSKIVYRKKKEALGLP
jgi:hypothetical protein